MKLLKFSFSLIFTVITFIMCGQTELTMSGKTYNNTNDTWVGVDIPRSQPTQLIFRNNTITSINRYGYLLQAGDEGVRSTNNNLDGAIITGNKLVWTGTDMKVIPHGIFTGHNRNVIIKYNYLDDVPMGIIRKSSNNMSNTSGGVAYNIVKGGVVGMVVKGMSNVNIFNNTFYNDRTPAQTWRPLIQIYKNTDNGNNSVAHGTKIYNNIFYTKHQTFSITITDAESLTGLECDYNVYWCENGSPQFSVNGITMTFKEWQAMGFDEHSVIVNPQFVDFKSFVPAKRLDYGKDLGVEWRAGLATDAVWSTIDPASAEQNGKWQAGAVVYAAGETGPPSAGRPPSQPGEAEVISVYPNPATSFLIIDIQNPSPGIIRTIRVFDFAGKLCMEKELTTDQTHKVPVNLKPGFYMMHIAEGSVVRLTQKLIIVA